MIEKFCLRIQQYSRIAGDKREMNGTEQGYGVLHQLLALVNTITNKYRSGNMCYRRPPLDSCLFL
jgi:hypothetical protein